MKTESIHTPEDLVQTFATCPNFPAEHTGVLALAQALKRASVDFRIAMDRIVQECCDSSAFCPTPRDLRTVAIQMRDQADMKRKGNQQAEWERMYGPPQVDWSSELIGVLATADHGERLRAIHIRAIRDTLHYTEGDGIGKGDRAFWDGDHSNYGARRFNEDNYPELVAQVRAAGGWQTERELQIDWIDIPWQPTPSTARKGGTR